MFKLKIFAGFRSWLHIKRFWKSAAVYIVLGNYMILLIKHFCDGNRKVLEVYITSASADINLSEKGLTIPFHTKM